MPDELLLDFEPDERPICEYCGEFIDFLGQPCPALDDGRCEP